MLRVVAALALAPLLVLAPAQAQSTKDRLYILEQAVADLQARAPSASDSALKIGRLEQEVQSLTGRVEELSFQLDQANARIASLTAALSGEAGAPAMAATGGPAQLGSPDPIADQIAAASAGAVELPLNPDEAFEYASSFLTRSDYPNARRAFELYVAAFPNHPRTADAQFRLGEIYLATGANAEAADAFIAHIRQYPNNGRAAEAYLKLGTAFARLQKNSEACQVFKSMRGKFPNAAPAVQQRADAEMARINCR